MVVCKMVLKFVERSAPWIACAIALAVSSVLQIQQHSSTDHSRKDARHGAIRVTNYCRLILGQQLKTGRIVVSRLQLTKVKTSGRDQPSFGGLTKILGARIPGGFELKLVYALRGVLGLISRGLHVSRMICFATESGSCLELISGRTYVRWFLESTQSHAHSNAFC